MAVKRKVRLAKQETGERRSMDRFLRDQNIARYRRLRDSSTGETERRMIIKLLVEEMAKLKMSKNEHQQDKFARRSNSEYVRWWRM